MHECRVCGMVSYGRRCPQGCVHWTVVVGWFVWLLLIGGLVVVGLHYATEYEQNPCVTPPGQAERGDG